MGEVLDIPTLGRPFGMGMLYDQRKDQLIPGITLWDSEDLRKDLTSQDKPYTSYDVLTEDKIEDKVSALDINQSLKLSFLGGLFNVSGSGKYMTDRKRSMNVTRMTLKYNCTSKYEQLSMKHLGRGNVKYSDVFDKQIATHVVVGLVYGAQAFFVFDREFSEGEEKNEINGKLEGIINSVPRGGLSVVSDMKDKAVIDKLHCKFYGDFILDQNPTTFQDAVAVYKTLPDLLGSNKENTVPIRVYLYPLFLLDPNAAKMVKEINFSIVKHVEDFFEHFKNAEEWCRVLVSSDICNLFSTVKSDLLKYQKHLESYRLNIKSKLLSILPDVRGGIKEENNLLMLLQDCMGDSPFSYGFIKNWLAAKENEIKMLEAYMENLKGAVFLHSNGDLEKELVTQGEVVCFTFQVQCDQALHQMEAHLNRNGECDQKVNNERMNTYWFEKTDVIQQVRQLSQSFKTYMKCNMAVRFVVQVKEMENPAFMVTITAYKNGQIVEENFQPPSEVENIQATQDETGKFVVKWAKPKYGGGYVKKYQVTYKKTGDEHWRTEEITTTSETHTLQISADEILYLKVRAKCQIGMSPESEMIFQPKNYKEESFAQRLMKTAESVSSGSPAVVKLQLKLKMVDEEKKVKVIDVCGANSEPIQNTSEKVVMILGETDSGKTTLVNAMANFLLGVKWSDSFRFDVTCGEHASTKDKLYSKTQYVTAYRFFNVEGTAYNFTIIDTPGYCSAEGIRLDLKIHRQILGYFGSTDVAKHLNAVLITQVHGKERAEQEDSYIIQSLMGCFARDMKDNVFRVALKANGKMYADDQFQLKFENSALFSSNSFTNICYENDKIFWESCMKCIAHFIKHLESMESKSFEITKTVLEERTAIEKVFANYIGIGKEKEEYFEDYMKEIYLEGEYKSSMKKTLELKITPSLCTSFNLHDHLDLFIEKEKKLNRKNKLTISRLNSLRTKRKECCLQ